MTPALNMTLGMPLPLMQQQMITKNASFACRCALYAKEDAMRSRRQSARALRPPGWTPAMSAGDYRWSAIGHRARRGVDAGRIGDAISLPLQPGMHGKPVIILFVTSRCASSAHKMWMSVSAQNRHRQHDFRLGSIPPLISAIGRRIAR